MARASGELIKATEALLARRLESLGFEKKKKNVFLRPLTKDVSGWLGLNLATHVDARVHVNPVVGVRHDALADALASLCSEKKSAAPQPTLSTNVGYLGEPKAYVQYPFAGSSEDGKTADALVQAVREHGQAFMQRYSSLEAIVGALEAGEYVLPFQVKYKLPLAYRLLGRESEARSLVQKGLRDIEGRDDPESAQYRTFARGFLDVPHVKPA